jgi:hypothetical protein
VEGLYIGYMGNRKRGTQVIEPNLNGLGPNIQWIRLLSPNTISHIHTHTHTYIYIYIYIERERERERENFLKNDSQV